MNNGWICLHRQIVDNKLWMAEEFTKAQAWIDLLLLAAYDDYTMDIRGNLIIVKRGQVGYSQDKLAARWKWSRKKVKAFLNSLEKEHQIKTEKHPIIQLVTIENYEKFQLKYHQKPDRSPTEARQNSDAYNINYNKNNKKKKITGTSVDFTIQN